MAYSTITDLQKYIETARLIELCTDLVVDAEEEPITIESAEVTGPVNEAIESADAEIDSYLLARWTGLRDISPVPPIVNLISCLLALDILFGRRQKSPGRLDAQIERWREWMDKVNRGVLVLPKDSAGATEAEVYARWLTDAETEADSDLPTNDRRNFKPSKLKNITGV